MGWSLKQVIVAIVLFLAVAGCTTIAPPVEPTTPTHRTKSVGTTTAPKVVKHKNVSAKKLLTPVKKETAPVIAPLGGGGAGGSGGGGGGWG
ncbi:hypothetical protein FJ950_27465 [Mesorhizobium sp. B2-3-14]|nr:hypothetical protein FJ950_27465 [Mesorhizobium sp. B2-3-14]